LSIIGTGHARGMPHTPLTSLRPTPPPPRPPSQAKRKEIDRLPDFHKVDCVTVNAAPLKSALDGVCQRYADALVLALRKSVLGGLRAVEAYLERGLACVSSRPSSMQEIAQAKKEWRAVSELKPAMTAALRQCEEQRKLLAASSGGLVDVSEVAARLSRLPNEWETFEAGMEAFNTMIEEQRNVLKGTWWGAVGPGGGSDGRWAWVALVSLHSRTARLVTTPPPRPSSPRLPCRQCCQRSEGRERSHRQVRVAVGCAQAA
jgi:hypothetical protein